MAAKPHWRQQKMATEPHLRDYWVVSTGAKDRLLRGLTRRSERLDLLLEASRRHQIAQPPAAGAQEPRESRARPSHEGL
jgi:hypothetical protein